MVGMLDAITSLEEWQERVRLLEQDLEVHHSQWVMEAKKPRNTTTTHPPTIVSSSTTTATTYNSPRIPRLTDNEKTLLSLHLGCFKCRTFYAGHISPNCKVTRCSLDACRNVTPKNAMKAKATFKKKQPAMHIAAVFEESDNKDYFEDCEEQGEGDEYVSHPFCFPKHLRCPSPVHPLPFRH
jgi:hypothetical protein